MTSAVAIINWNSGGLLCACIESLLATATRAEILVVDNASEDGSLEAVEHFRNRIDFIRNSVNRGFAAAVNQAFQATSTEYVLILNPDVRVPPGAISSLEEFMNSHPRAGAVGGDVNEKYPPRNFPTVGGLILENFGIHLGRDTDRIHPESDPSHVPFQCDQPAAAALIVRREAYESVEGFDEQFYPAWYEDVDFCLRLKKTGWENYFVPQAKFLHEGGYSTRVLGSGRFANAYYSNQARFARKHFGPVGSAAIRVSIVAGMIGRMIGRPKRAATYGKVLVGALRGW